MIQHYDDEQLDHAGRVRHYAAMLLIGIYNSKEEPELQSDVTIDYIRAGLKPREIAAAADTLRRVYGLEDRDDRLDVLREMVRPDMYDSEPPERDTPAAEAMEHHHEGDDGVPL